MVRPTEIWLWSRTDSGRRCDGAKGAPGSSPSSGAAVGPGDALVAPGARYTLIVRWLGQVPMLRRAIGCESTP